ncbi:MarR family winged helix-turn-helix transcriptional regulator [Kitasatospora sp. NPDC057541]|uniref:MarR family winged helix-turn-helix transcriptional regulator n=1 Tax=unclassified Kitasatospora TaxID=2633591 RepID=UPI0036860055
MGQRRESDIELWNQLAVLVAEVGTTVDRRLTREAGISLSEFQTLNALAAAEPEGLRIQQLAEALGLNQSSASRLVARLQGQGLVSRGVSETDRRGVLARITEQGKETARQARDLFDREMGQALDLASIDGRTATVVARLRYTPGERPPAS